MLLQTDPAVYIVDVDGRGQTTQIFAHARADAGNTHGRFAKVDVARK